MRWFKPGSAIGGIGELLLVLPFLPRILEWLLELRIVRVSLEMANLGQAIDFIIQHLENPGWLGNVWVQFGIVVLGFLLISWDRKRPSWLPSPELSPRQMIITGLVIILVGVVAGTVLISIGLWNQPKVNALIADIPAPSTAVPPIQKPPQKPQRKYSRADVDKLTPALQRISDAVTTQGAPLSWEIYDFCFKLRDNLNKLGTVETTQRMQALASRADKFGIEMQTIQNNTAYYQDEINYIIDAKKGDAAGSVAIEMRNVARWISGLTSPLNQGGSEILQNMSQQLSQKTKDFQQWTIDTPKRIQEIRKDLDAAG